MLSHSFLAIFWDCFNKVCMLWWLCCSCLSLLQVLGYEPVAVFGDCCDEVRMLWQLDASVKICGKSLAIIFWYFLGSALTRRACTKFQEAVVG